MNGANVPSMVMIGTEISNSDDAELYQDGELIPTTACEIAYFGNNPVMVKATLKDPDAFFLFANADYVVKVPCSDHTHDFECKFDEAVDDDLLLNISKPMNHHGEL